MQSYRTNGTVLERVQYLGVLLKLAGVRFVGHVVAVERQLVRWTRPRLGQRRLRLVQDFLARQLTPSEAVFIAYFCLEKNTPDVVEAAKVVAGRRARLELAFARCLPAADPTVDRS